MLTKRLRLAAAATAMVGVAWPVASSAAAGPTASRSVLISATNSSRPPTRSERRSGGPVGATTTPSTASSTPAEPVRLSSRRAYDASASPLPVADPTGASTASTRQVRTTSGGVPALTSPPPPTVGDDALIRKTVADLGDFTGWLRANHVAGFVGEVGWPDDANGDGSRYNALANAWFDAADAADLWVTTWMVSEAWGQSHPLAPYEAAAPNLDLPLSIADTQSSVIEAHPSTSRYLRGVNYSGGENDVEPCAALCDNYDQAASYPGIYDYGSAASYRFLASRGVKLIRLPFRWERLQPRLHRPLDPTALSQLRAAVDRIHAAGMVAVLDMHNFAHWSGFDVACACTRSVVLGSKDLPVGAFVDVWSRLAQAFVGHPGVIGYDLMNEPLDMPSVGALSPRQVWDGASQAALDGIRRVDRTTTVIVAGYFRSGAQGWSHDNPKPWIVDPANNVRYEAHHYWDHLHASTYASYDAELKAS
ncbi:MAG: glycoside hydrolase family 5 protein [Acidimicrobiales bacterium]